MVSALLLAFALAGLLVLLLIGRKG